MSGLNKDIAPMVADELKRYMPDLVEVVRCKDCRYWDTSREWTGAEGKHKCEIDNLIVPPDGYCYWGERRDDER